MPVNVNVFFNVGAIKSLVINVDLSKCQSVGQFNWRPSAFSFCSVSFWVSIVMSRRPIRFW